MLGNFYICKRNNVFCLKDLEVERSRTENLTVALEKSRSDYQHARVELKHALAKIDDLQRNAKAEQTGRSSAEGQEEHQSPADDPPSPSSKSNSNAGSDTNNVPALQSLRDQVPQWIY